MPGPDNLLVLTESVIRGKRYGIALSAGLASGVLVHTTIAATGLSILLQSSDYAFEIIKYLGALYMFYLAIQTIIEKQSQAKFSDEISDDYNFWKLAKKGFIMNVLNPKVTLFFIAFLPQFISKSGYKASLQMLILGIIFMVQAFVIFSLVAKLSGNLNQYLNNPRFWKITKWVKAIVLIAIALFLIF
jgi:threonine/homoserine/homoserine lactone efflux protein